MIIIIIITTLSTTTEVHTQIEQRYDGEDEDVNPLKEQRMEDDDEDARLQEEQSPKPKSSAQSHRKNIRKRKSVQRWGSVNKFEKGKKMK
jgi:hypothetical protein